MAKVKISGIPEIERKIEETFGKVRRSPEINKEIGKFVTDRIRFEARRGKPLNVERRFPDLKKSSVSIRTYLAALNPTQVTFKPNRSNTTLTGQLLNAVVYELLPRAGISIFVDKTIRDPYIINRKGEIGEVLRNSEVDRELRKRGFEIYTAKGIESEPQILKRINAILKKYVRRAIKANFGS